MLGPWGKESKFFPRLEPEFLLLEKPWFLPPEEPWFLPPEKPEFLPPEADEVLPREDPGFLPRLEPDLFFDEFWLWDFGSEITVTPKPLLGNVSGLSFCMEGVTSKLFGGTGIN